METVCSMINCDNSFDSSKFCHAFPFPVDFDQCMRWVENCGKPQFFADFAFGGAQPFINKVICSDHFHRDDFINPSCIGTGLKPDAVPILSSREYKDRNIVVKKEHFVCTSDEYPLKEVDVEGHKRKEPDVDSTLEEFPNGPEKQELFDKSCLPLLIVVNDENGINSASQKSRKAFQAAWKRALESVEERESRNRANALRNAVNRAKETNEEKQARNSANACRNAHRRANENEEQRKDRLYKNALRASMRRNMETEEEQAERRRKNALRAAHRRNTETEEQKAERRLKDKMRSAKRRNKETEVQTKIRKYNDAVRAAFRRSTETEDQKQQRRMCDVIRATRRRNNETREQRTKRLKLERERAAKRRLLKKLGVMDGHGAYELEFSLTDLNDLQSTNDEVLEQTYKQYLTDKMNSDIKKDTDEKIKFADLINQSIETKDSKQSELDSNSNSTNVTITSGSAGDKWCSSSIKSEVVWCT